MEAELFNKNILEQLIHENTLLPRIDGLLIRPLKSTDYEKGYVQLLEQLTEVGNLSREQFLNRFYSMKSKGDYYIIVVENLNNSDIIASGTLVVEQKFIHNCALRGRVEDLVVNNKYRGQNLGKLIINLTVQLARYLRCYKVSLECRDHLIPYYESLGFKRETNNATCLNIRFPHEGVSEQSRL